MSDQDLDYEAIGRKIDKGLEEQKRFYRMVFFSMHLLSFIIAMLAMWGIAMTNAQVHAALFDNGIGPALAVILPTVLWSFMILSHGSFLYIESTAGEKSMRDKLMMTELGNEILRRGLMNSGLLAKAKRRAAAESGERVSLSDDGELLSADGDEQTALGNPKIRDNHNGRA